MSDIDQEDAFLYGSDEDVPVTTATTEAPATTDTPADAATVDATPAEAADESDSGEDSDLDIELILGTQPSAPSAPAAAVDTETAVSTEASASQPSHANVVVPIQGVDINAVGMYQGKPITELLPEEIKEKPWRLPGVDLSDYFNFGFDEFTWIAYCMKQDKLRQEFDMQKWLAKVQPLPRFNGGMPMMPMPPFMQGMPPGFVPGRGPVLSFPAALTQELSSVPPPVAGMPRGPGHARNTLQAAEETRTDSGEDAASALTSPPPGSLPLGPKRPKTAGSRPPRAAGGGSALEERMAEAKRSSGARRPRGRRR